jgi:hypothetical protein
MACDGCRKYESLPRMADFVLWGTACETAVWPARVGPRIPALAGRLRRAQTFLRILGIDVAFSREGRAGSRIIRIRTTVENTVSIDSNAACDNLRRPGP